MIKPKKIVTITVFALIFILFTSFNSLTKAYADTLEFDVNPSGQPYFNIGYFKMNAKPNQTVDLPVEISNVTNKSIQIDIQKLNALTSVYGNIQYVKETKLHGSKLTDEKRGLAQYLTGGSSVTLSAGEHKILHFTLKTPSDISTGTILGGLSFKKHNDGGSTTKSSKGVVLNTEFERVIGVEADYGNEKAQPIEVLSSGVETAASGPNVNVGIKNPSPFIVDNFHFDYTVSDDNKVLFNGKTNDFKFAPSTEINYPIQWQYKTFSAGNYNLEVTLYKNGQKLAQKKTQFVVPKEKVVEYQKETGVTSVSGTGSNWVYQISALAIALWVFSLLFIVFKRKKDKKEEQNESKLSA